MKTGIIAMAVLSLYASGAAGTFLDGNTLLRRLQGPDNSLNKAASIGYIMGIADDQERLNLEKVEDKLCFQVPPSVLSTQLADITQIWLERNPQLRHYAAPDLIASALKEAYPCKK